MPLLAAKRYFSFSQLNQITKCAHKYMLSYLEGKKFTNMFFIVGGAVDQAINANLANKREYGELLPIGDIIDIAQTTVEDDFLHPKRELFLNEEEKTEGKAKVLDTAIKKATNLVKLHAEELAPKLNPMDIQKEIHLNLDELGVDLMGYIDIVEKNGTVRDTKTKKRTPPQNAAHVSDQLTIYAMAEFQETGKIPDKLTLDFLVDNKKATLTVRETTRNETDFAVIYNRIETALSLIDAGIFPPNGQDDTLCSPTYCEFYRVCKYARQSIYPAAF